MADSTDSRSFGDNTQSVVKQRLTDYRQLVVSLHSVLVWESDVFPIALSAAVSLLFLIIWYLESSVLTTLSAIGIVSAVVDYTLPMINQNFFDPSKWSASKESKFDRICTELSESWTAVTTACVQWNQMKASNPKIYYSILLSSLLTLSWIGNVVHNLLLTYLLILILVLFPGLKQRGIVDKYATLLMSYVQKLKRN